MFVKKGEVSLRDHTCCYLLAQGMSVRQIAKELGYHSQLLYESLQRLCYRADVDNNMQLAIKWHDLFANSLLQKDVVKFIEERKAIVVKRHVLSDNSL